MTRQLSTMVSSGMTILRALYVLEAQTESDALKETLVDVRKDVEAGLPLSDALERHPKVFDPLFVAMTRAGETGGVLDSALIRVADQLEKAEALRRQVKSAMTYPTVIITFAMIVVLGARRRSSSRSSQASSRSSAASSRSSRASPSRRRTSSRASGTC